MLWRGVTVPNWGIDSSRTVRFFFIPDWGIDSMTVRYFCMSVKRKLRSRSTFLFASPSSLRWFFSMSAQNLRYFVFFAKISSRLAYKHTTNVHWNLVFTRTGLKWADYKGDLSFKVTRVSRWHECQGDLDDKVTRAWVSKWPECQSDLNVKVT